MRVGIGFSLVCSAAFSSYTWRIEYTYYMLGTNKRNERHNDKVQLNEYERQQMLLTNMSQTIWDNQGKVHFHFHWRTEFDRGATNSAFGSTKKEICKSIKVEILTTKEEKKRIGNGKRLGINPSRCYARIDRHVSSQMWFQCTTLSLPLFHLQRKF